MSGPLTGIRILDLSAVLSGPLAATWLCDQGAEVVKVESFEGDIIRRTTKGPNGLNANFISSNRGKKAIAVDLKREEGIEIVKKMVPYFDVILQNFRPGAVERLGLDYYSIRTINPTVIYCSISGFGSSGPYAGKRIYDPIIQGISGLNAIQGGPDGSPKMIRTLMPDVVTALTAAQAVTAALWSRERTGEGQHITLAMIDAMIALTWPDAMIGNMLLDGSEPGAPNRKDELIFQTSDGYITAVAISNSEWHGLCQALGHEEWLQNERLGTPARRTGRTAETAELVAPILAEKPSKHWLDLLDAHGVPCGPVLNCAELPENEQIIANELIEVLDHPGIGKIRQARPAARFSATPARIQGFAPTLGEHSREILRDLDYSEQDIDELFDNDIVH
ncbi:CoA transferase [Haliea sp. E1-2-M8]|uniref:CaiB/BaiF CoA transferase family protein n=1 Tax=Haliea sp. E1-2-M8 TaxID=3064706 RepID=UPI002724D9F3|nr:CoA transferase [Haliea sp. E1-2-M8]MDO8864063.1 CoA transferase [Haliea sp. E1-2-M8]